MTETMKRFMKQAGILIAALLFISTEKCNGSVLKHLDEDYKRAGELKQPAIFGGKVGSQYSGLFFVFVFSIFLYLFFFVVCLSMSFILVVTFKRLNFILIGVRQILMAKG